MKLNWREATLGEFVQQGTHYLVKTHEVIGDVNGEVLIKDRRVVLSRHSTSRGRVVGYSVEVLNPKTRVFLAETHIFVFNNPHTIEHKFLKHVVEDPLFTASVFRAGKHRNYMFISRVREEESNSEGEEDSE